MLVNGNNGTAAATAVTGAISAAASATGTSFDYLLATARVESGLNPHANARTSSAGGLFQFINQTWLATLKQSGAALGYGRFANAIVQTSSGRFDVPNPGMRAQILALRADPAASAAMAGAFTRSNAALLTDRLGRPPTDGELYIAHFLGAGGGGRLIELAANNPRMRASAAFPGAARANRSIFYDRQGNARSASGVYAELVRRYEVARAGNATMIAATPPTAPQPVIDRRQTAAALSGTSVAASAAVASANAAPAPTAASDTAPVSAPRNSAPLFHGLYNSGPSDSVSPIVRDLWQTRPRVAAALTGQNVPQQTAAAVAPPAAASRPDPTPNDRVLDLFRDLPTDMRPPFDRS
jgi:hypothetical protein